MRLSLAGGDRGRRVTAAVAAALVLVGGGLLVKAAADQRSAPEPPPSSSAAATSPESGASSTTAPPSTTAAAPSTAPASTATGLPPSPATAISIPAIGVRSAVQPVGLDGDGAIAVPQPGPHYDQAAWFTGSPGPGQVGPSVVVGHVDSARNGPSVFFRLGALKRGDTATMTRADGRAVPFTVYRVERYRKNAFPTAQVYANTAGPELRLITCGGSFDSGTGHYEDNVVVYARQG